MEAYDQLREMLLVEDKHQGYYFDLKYVLKKAHSDLPRDEVNRIIASFENRSLVSTPARKTRGSQLLVKVNPAAYSYFEDRKLIIETEKAEAAANALKEIEERKDRSRSIKTTFIGYVAGLFSGIALMWFMIKLFP